RTAESRPHIRLQLLHRNRRWRLRLRSLSMAGSDKAADDDEPDTEGTQTFHMRDPFVMRKDKNNDLPPACIEMQYAARHMPKYLFEANYVGDGIKGLINEGGTSRRAAAEKALKSLGGKLDAFYYAFGDRD